MNYEEALQEMIEGEKIRLPEWRGYWFSDNDGNIHALTKDGEYKPALVSIYENRTDFEIAEGLDFGWAICALKAGKLVTRKGWNGKGMFVFMQVPATISDEVIPKMTSLPDSVKKEFGERGMPISYFNQLAIVKKDNSINGWAPSVSDALAEDWQLFSN